MADRLSDELFVSLLSFGYRYGIPDEADMILDARFLPNPHWEKKLRSLSGLDDPVRKFVVEREESREFLDRIIDLLRFVGPRFLVEQKKRLVLAVGCTGGRHRSVALAEELARRLEEETGVVVSVGHRDIEKAEKP